VAWGPGITGIDEKSTTHELMMLPVSVSKDHHVGSMMEEAQLKSFRQCVRIHDMMEELTTRARALTLMECGDLGTWLDVSFGMRSAAGKANQQFEWLYSLPWMLSRVDNRVGVNLALDQYRSAPAERHHPATVGFMQKFESHMQAVADGHDSSSEEFFGAGAALAKSTVE
jgi:hypothetical protein